MKKLYSLMLTAAVVLLSSFQTKAELTTTITWDEPGSVQIFVGGTNDTNKVDIPEGATSYTATLDNTWGYTYIKAASGYILKECKCVETGEAINYIAYSQSFNVNMQTLDGKTVKVTASALQFDGEFTVNLLNGSDVVKCEIQPTKRIVALKNGEQTVRFDTDNENGINFYAKSTTAAEPYVKRNDKVYEWRDVYGDLVIFDNGTRKNNGIELESGDIFEVKYNNEEPAVEEESQNATVKLSLQGEASKALTMIFNVTKFKSIAIANEFEVEKGDKIRLVFNTLDYNVTVDGEAIEAAGAQTNVVYTIDADRTFTISATEREYDNVTVAVWTNDIDALVITDGANKIVDSANIQATDETMSYTFLPVESGVAGKTATVKKYNVTVTAKYGKAFVGSKNGYWIEFSDNGEFDTSMATAAQPVYVLAHEIVKDTKLVVWVRYNSAIVEIPELRDSRGTQFELKAGYNEFLVDPAYSGKFSSSVSFVEYDPDNEEDPIFTFYNNGVAAAKDSDTERYVTTIDGPAVFHLIGGQTATLIDVKANFDANAAGSAKVIVDRIHEITDASTSFKTVVGCDVEIFPGESTVYINGVRQIIVEDSKVFKAAPINMEDRTMHIAIGEFAEAVTDPAPNAEVSDFDGITVSFPGATSVEINTEDVGNIEFTAFNAAYPTADDFSIAVTVVGDAECPTFKITPSEIPTVGGYYQLTIPEAYFIIDGSIESEEIYTAFKINVPFDNNEIYFMPENDEDLDAVDFFDPEMYNGRIAFFFGEPGESDYVVEPAAPENIKVAMNGKLLTPGEDWTIDVYTEDGFTLDYGFIITFQQSAIENGELVIFWTDGAFNIDGTPCEAYDKRYNVVNAAQFASVFATPANGSTVDSFENITVYFPGATSVEKVGADDEVIFRSTDGMSFAAWNFTYEITSVDYFETGNSIPAVVITPNMMPTINGGYYFRIPEGFFRVDGTSVNPEIKQTFTLDVNIDMSEIEILYDPTADVIDIADFQGITVSIGEPYEYQIAANVVDGDEFAVIHNNKALEYYTEWGYSIEYNFFMVYFAEDFVITPGSYTVKIKEGALTISGQACPAIEHTWTVTSSTSGIDDITVDGENSEIYDLQGRKVAKPSTGFYIINGRKALIIR